MKEWKIAELDKEKCKKMASDWDIPFFLSVLLNVRNLDDKENAEKFLNGYNSFSSPFDMIDMDKLTNRLRYALDNFEKICVYGDYDADGVTATALFYSYLKKSGADVMYYMPKREEDGYGLNKNAIDKLKSYGVKLILTVDNGISAYEEVDYAKSVGIDCIITDHHRPPEIIPNAVAVVNPYREDCPSKFKYFSGVGVAFKSVVAMENGETDVYELMQEYGDLVTIGTIGDFVELKGETRDLVREGMKIISKAKRPGLRVILENMGSYGKDIDAVNVVFGIVPRINVSGRLDEADRAVQLLVEESYDSALEIFEDIEKKNTIRKDTESEICEIVEQKLREEPWRRYESIIFVEGEKWHQGVLGIVSSRLVKQHGKPCVVISYDGEHAKGSCRSVEGFSIHEAISNCSEFLERFGGHPMAAGINLKTSNISKFREAMLKYAHKHGGVPFPYIQLDCKLNPSTISRSMVSQLNKLKPFGSGNPEPIFGIYSLRLEEIRPIGGGRHIKLKFSRQNTILEAIYFGKSESDFLYKIKEVLDIAVTIHKNDFSYSNGVSLYISDIKISECDMSKILKGKQIYEKFKQGKDLEYEEYQNMYPTRDEIAVVYKYCKNNQGTRQRVDVALSRICENSIDSSKFYVILDILEELNIIDISYIYDEFSFKVNSPDKKTDLSESSTLQKIKRKLGFLEE